MTQLTAPTAASIAVLVATDPVIELAKRAIEYRWTLGDPIPDDTGDLVTPCAALRITSFHPQTKAFGASVNKVLFAVDGGSWQTAPFSAVRVGAGIAAARFSDKQLAAAAEAKLSEFRQYVAAGQLDPKILAIFTPNADLIF